MQTRPLALADVSALAFWLSPKAKQYDKAFERDVAAYGYNPDNYMNYLEGCIALPGYCTAPQGRPSLTHGDARALRAFLGTWLPIHATVLQKQDIVYSESLVAHAITSPIPPCSFVRLSERLLLPAPELLLMQMSNTLSIIEVIVLGSLLCSVFAFSGTGQVPRRKLTDVGRIKGFVAACAEEGARLPRGAGKLRRALPHIIENAASPAEISLGLRMELPASFGGYGFGKLLHNYPVDTGKLFSDGRSHTRYCDFFAPAHSVCIEYQSDAAHSGDNARKADSKRSNELLAVGVKQFDLLSEHLMSVKAMDAAALQIGQQIGARPFSSRQHHKREELCAEVAEALRRFGSLC